MGILRKLFTKRAYKLQGGDAIWSNGSFVSSGIAVTADTAMQATAVYACIKVRSETIASIPMVLYKRLPGGGKERAPEHPLYNILHDIPNKYQTSFEFREMLQGHADLRGNGYAQILRDAGGKVTELIPLHPARIEPKILPEGTVVYEYQKPKGGIERYLPEDIFHLKGFCADGIKGISPIDTAREAVGLALVAEQHGAKMFSNFARPGGIIKHPAKISKEAAERLRESWQKSYAGIDNAHKVSVLEEGMSWEAVGFDNRQTQFLETRKFQSEEIARLYRVPPHMIGNLDRATFSNIEQQSIDFVTHCIRPWLVRWEQAIAKCIFTEEERKVYFVEFLVDGLLRGDLLSRYQAYAVARNGGWFCVDEIREMENRNPLPDGLGQVYLEPLNMKEVGEELPDPEPTPQVIEPNKQPSNDESQDDDTKARAFAPVIKAALKRLFTKEQKAVRGKQLKDLEVSGFYNTQRSLITESLIPILQAAVITNRRSAVIGFDEAHLAAHREIEESQDWMINLDLWKELTKEQAENWPDYRADRATERILARIFGGNRNG